MAGATAERQENGVVNAIQTSIRKNKKNPITILGANGQQVTGVIEAYKFTGRQSTGSEPYTDVVFEQYNRNSINLSLKGESAASLAGGGLRGLELAAPGIATKFMKEAYDYLVKILKLKPGDKVPDIYGKIGRTLKEKIVIGNKAMGGPIDFMYIGPMNVVSKYDPKRNILSLNGSIIPAKEYAQTHDLYFRLRARREDQRFDPKAIAAGVPKIYGKSPSHGDSAGRIVVTDQVPSNATVITI